VTGTDDIADLIDLSQYRNILGVSDFDLPAEFAGVRKGVFVFNHNTPRHRILGSDFGDRVVLFHNHYMTSFMDNIALVLLAKDREGLERSPGTPDTRDILGAFARKFLAEQLYVLGDSMMARTLFIETLISFDDHKRAYFELRASDADLRHASNFFTSLASDFLLMHEVAHIVSGHDEFGARRDIGLEYLTDMDVFLGLSEKERFRLDEEVGADIAGLELTIRRYASSLSANDIKTYLRLVVELVTRMEVLYELAREVHRDNVDAGFDGGDMVSTMHMWQCRHLAMVRYIEDFPFGPRTVEPKASDQLLPLKWDQTAIDALTSGTLTAPFDTAARRVAETVARGFEPGAGFDAVINGTRQMRVLDRPIS
jgi:hypothetical protein